MIPLWIKIAYTVYVAVTVVVYSVKYPLGNFLWFSDIALVLTVPALWFESGLLAGMMTLCILLPEVFWNISYFGRLLTRKRLAGLTDYMFDSNLPMYLRALSWFHVFLPVLLLWVIQRTGYDLRAFAAQTVLAWIVLPLTYLLTDPEKNVNWVFGPGTKPQQQLPSLAYLGIVMLFFPMFVYLPTHLLLKLIFG